jgi:cell division septation protein DedD
MLGALVLIVAMAVTLAYLIGPDEVRRPSATSPAAEAASPRPAQPATPPSPATETDDDSAAFTTTSAASEPGDAAQAERAAPTGQSDTADNASVAGTSAADAPVAETAVLTPSLEAALRSPEPLALPTSLEASPRFALVVLSTTDEAEAQRIAERYRALGYRAGVVYGQYRDIVRYRVAVGSFASQSDAEAALAAVRDELPRGAWVLPLRSAFDLVALR